jgi:ornithine cyclodeaminase/alanine dehydrogenase-like protein (mu-crystallin family)
MGRESEKIGRASVDRAPSANRLSLTQVRLESDSVELPRPPASRQNRADVRYVTEAEVEAVLTPAVARAAVEGSLRRIAKGEVESRPRERFALPDGQFAVMACVDRGLGYAGLKTYAWTPQRAPFLVVLFTLDGEPAGVIEAAALGERRTAAASAVAAQRLARDSVETLGLIGCGRQAASHLAAFRDALPTLRRTVAFAPSRERREAFCRAHDCESAASAEDAAACDVVLTATTSREPVLHGDWVQPGAFVCGVGANDPHARELDDRVLERASLVCVDWLEQALEEAGDLIDPVAGGLLDRTDVRELHELVAGSVRGRGGDDEITVFKSSGMAAWDLAAAVRVLELLTA